MKFTGSFVGKFFLVVLCILLGVILAVGGEALAGYIVLTRQGMVGTISDKVEDNLANSGYQIQFDDETKAMSLLQWGTTLAGSFTNMNETTIGDMEKLIGINFVSKMVEQTVGVESAKVQASTIGGIGKTISDNLTLNNAKTNLGISFPDMPIFQKEEFLNQPLSTAFKEFDSYTLADVINIGDDANAVLKELKNAKIKDLGGKTTDNTIKQMFLCEIMTINDSSSKTLKALKYNSIESFYQYEEDGVTIKLDGEGHKMYQTKEFTEIVDGNPVTTNRPLKGINDAMDDLLVKDVVEITETSSAVLRKMRTPTQEETDAGKDNLFGTEDLKVKELGGNKVNDIIDNTEIGEIVTIVDTDPVNPGDPAKSEPIMIALKNTKIMDLNNKIKTLKLNEIFKDTELATGALSLIDPETTLPNIPSAMTAVMQSATTATLKGKGLISADSFTNVSGMKYDQQAFVYNNNMGGMLKGMVDFIQSVSNASPDFTKINPPQTTISSATFSSITDFVATYNQYDSVDFGGNTTITITIDATADECFLVAGLGKYVIPLFNIKDNNTVTLTATGGDIALGVYNSTEDGSVPRIASGKSIYYTELVREPNQYGYFYVKGSSVGFDRAYTTIEQVAATNVSLF